MRTPDELHSMIDYLEQKDQNHPDIAVLRWALKEDQRPVDAGRDQERKRFEDAIKEQQRIMESQCNTIADLREKLSRFVPGARS
jgi:hypothetical protein